MSFAVKRAESAVELDALFVARHRVFVEEQRYNAPMPGGRLLDRFDAFPGTLNLMALAEGEVVAGVRGLIPGEVGTPADSFYDFTPHLPEGGRVCAGSMLFVSPHLRGGSRVTRALLGMLYVWARAQGCTHVLGVAAPAAEGLFYSHGYRALTGRFRHAPTGLLATPVMLALDALEPSLARFVERNRLPAGLERFERHVLAPGESLAAPSVHSPLDYAVLDGRLAVSFEGTGEPVRELGPGERWGHVPVLSTPARGARATALTAVELAVVDRRAAREPRADEGRLRSAALG
jgi:N-acyl-L-homoserine lactone synthetase